MAINTTLTGYLTVDDVLNKMLKEEKITFLETKLKETNRPGMDAVLDFLRSTDFYTAPSSTAYHSNYDGGLLDHSILVYIMALRYRDVLIDMYPEIADKLPVESITISTLLHDICKACFYKKVFKWRKNPETDVWETYETYTIEDNFPIGHGEKSVIMLQNFGLQLSPEEMIAIRFHMGTWDGAMLTNDVKYSYSKALNTYPLMVLVQMADNSSSLLLEKQNKN